MKSAPGKPANRSMCRRSITPRKLRRRRSGGSDCLRIAAVRESNMMKWLDRGLARDSAHEGDIPTTTRGSSSSTNTEVTISPGNMRRPVSIR